MPLMKGSPKQAVAAALHNAYDSGKSKKRVAMQGVAKVMKARGGKKK